ncbi:hypothetical protein B1207_11315 [Legionella quinlivanii]|uniref:Uncharacterized protein n=1 Tax=Legionella quinlivanii TaxID=45073 RepID=A0A364LHE4_9GAMM|nr:hypothetical protein [Legionella quinlivanii]RAP35677.1 hypothetical protein B1207_11315 [Legionella quinlivanii]
MFNFFKAFSTQQSPRLTAFPAPQVRSICGLNSPEQLVTRQLGFLFSQNHSRNGHLLQINLQTHYASDVAHKKNKDEEKEQESIIHVTDSVEQMVKRHPNSLFIGVTPTQKMSKGAGLYPGHGFSFLTNTQGQIMGHVSKRPDTLSIVGKRNAYRDAQFEGKSSEQKLDEQMYVYNPTFDGFKGDIRKWYQRSLNLNGTYPLLIAQLPLGPGVKVSSDDYLAREKELIEYKRPYHLFPERKPDGSMQRPNNCLTAVAQVVLGYEYYSTLCDSMYCQQALVELVKRVIENPDNFLKQTQELNLLEGVEDCPLKTDDYLGTFLC